MVPLPDNFERAMGLGKAAFDQQNWQTAKNYFALAYEQEAVIEANCYYAKSLLMLGEAEQAWQLIKECATEYLANLVYLETYFDGLIATEQLLAAEQILVQLIKKPHIVDLKNWQDKLATAIAYAEQSPASRLNQAIQCFSQLADQKPSEQVKLASQLVYLSEKQLLDLAYKDAANQDVFFIVRIRMFEELALLDCQQEVSFLAIDQVVYKLVPAYIGIRTDRINGWLQHSSLDEKLQKHAPSLSHSILETMKLHLGCFYPVIDHLVPDMTVFESTYLLEYGILAELPQLTEEQQQQAEQINTMKQQVEMLLLQMW